MMATHRQNACMDPAVLESPSRTCMDVGKKSYLRGNVVLALFVPDRGFKECFQQGSKIHEAQCRGFLLRRYSVV